MAEYPDTIFVVLGIGWLISSLIIFFQKEKLHK